MFEDVASIMLFRAVKAGTRFVDCLYCKDDGITEPLICCSIDPYIHYKGKGKDAVLHHRAALHLLCPRCGSENTVLYSDDTVPLQPRDGIIEAIFEKRPAWLIPTQEQIENGIPGRLPIPSHQGAVGAIMARMGVKIETPEGDPFDDVDNDDEWWAK